LLIDLIPSTILTKPLPRESAQETSKYIRWVVLFKFRECCHHHALCLFSIILSSPVLLAPFRTLQNATYKCFGHSSTSSLNNHCCSRKQENWGLGVYTSLSHDALNVVLTNLSSSKNVGDGEKTRTAMIGVIKASSTVRGNLRKITGTKTSQPHGRTPSRVLVPV
jgi:hypothetical protein